MITNAVGARSAAADHVAAEGQQLPPTAQRRASLYASAPNAASTAAPPRAPPYLAARAPLIERERERDLGECRGITGDDCAESTRNTTRPRVYRPCIKHALRRKHHAIAHKLYRGIVELSPASRASPRFPRGYHAQRGLAALAKRRHAAGECARARYARTRKGSLRSHCWGSLRSPEWSRTVDGCAAFAITHPKTHEHHECVFMYYCLHPCEFSSSV